MAEQRRRSNVGPRAQFRVYRQPDGGLRLTDESTDPDGKIIARLWTSSRGRSGRGRSFILKPSAVQKEVMVQLTVVDNHQAHSTIAKLITLPAAIEQHEEEDIPPFHEDPDPEEVDPDDEDDEEEQPGADPNAGLEPHEQQPPSTQQPPPVDAEALGEDSLFDDEIEDENEGVKPPPLPKPENGPPGAGRRPGQNE